MPRYFPINLDDGEVAADDDTHNYYKVEEVQVVLGLSCMLNHSYSRLGYP